MKSLWTKNVVYKKKHFFLGDNGLNTVQFYKYRCFFNKNFFGIYKNYLKY